MVMLAEVVDGVIGVDTHRDFNQVEIARPSGAVNATRTFTANWRIPTGLAKGTAGAHL